MLERLWYSNNPIVWLMLPLTLLFWLLSSLRRLAFKLGLKKSYHPGIPVVIVGNISVGGNGKTPMVIYLVELLQRQGYKPGVLSRGYGGSQQDFPCLLTPEHIAKDVGDEPFLIFQRIGCPVVIDPVRSRGAEYLKQSGANIIICDDGLQHYALKRDIELVVIDAERRFGNCYLLPMGPLRESCARLNSVDFIVANGNSNTEEYEMTLVADKFVNIKSGQIKLAAEFSQAVTALAGIGNPARFFNTIKQLGLTAEKNLAFADHYQFGESDIPKGTVVMTEKDAVKCKSFASEDSWYLPVTAKLSDNFDQQFLAKLNK